MPDARVTYLDRDRYKNSQKVESVNGVYVSYERV